MKSAKTKAIITLWWLQESTYFKNPFIFYPGNMVMNYLVFRLRSKATVVVVVSNLGPSELPTSI